MDCDRHDITRALALGPGESAWSARHEAVHDALVDAGRCWAAGRAPDGGRGWREALEPAVRAYLTHGAADLRDAALRTLAVYWGLPTYEEIAAAMSREDADAGVRATALDGWAAYARGRGGAAARRAALGEFAARLRDRSEPALVRAAAYRALLGASGVLDDVPPPQVAKLLDVFDDVDARVDWGLVDRAAGGAPG
jgi:hypothetical protein